MIKGDLNMNSSWKLRLIPALMAAVLLTLSGCDNDDVILDPAPGAPQQVFSVTGNGVVTVYWNSPYESDIKEFVVLRSFEESDNYKEIVRIKAESNPNLDLVQYFYDDATVSNGITYFYAVMTVDFAKQQSGLSAETVWDTPRPQGIMTLMAVESDSSPAGFNFKNQIITDTSLADIFLTTSGDVPFLNVRYDTTGPVTDIQDMGFQDDFDFISISPDSGWSAFDYVEIIEGHIYVIWIFDNHFAKLRVRSASSTSAIFEWAYQEDEGNLQLKPKPE